MSLALSDNLAPQPMTDIFTDDTNINRRKCHRTVPMKVLALGVGRTGTACEYYGSGIGSGTGYTKTETNSDRQLCAKLSNVWAMASVTT
jgi:hypothetical protein